MAKLTSNFNCNRFMSEFERDVKDAILSEVNAHSEEILSEYIGESIDAICPSCGHTEMTVISGGKARCPLCGYTDKVQLELNWG